MRKTLRGFLRGNPWDMDKGARSLLVIVPRRVKALQLQKKLKIFFFRGTNIVDEFRLFCYNSSLRGYGRESLAAQIHGGARQWKNIANPKRLWASSR